MNNQLTSTTNHPEKPHIIINLLIRNTLFITFAGALSGAIYGAVIVLLSSVFNPPTSTDFLQSLTGTVIFLVSMAIVGGFIGGALGLTAGLIISLITIPLTLTLYYPPTNKPQYTLIIRTLTALTTALTTYLLTPIILTTLLPGSTIENGLDPEYLAIPTIAALTSYLISGPITRWYLRQFPPVT